MKKILLIFTLLIAVSIPVYADSVEKVRVIKFDKDTDDLIVEQTSGERLLIQHNRLCGSMTTEFPVYLVWEGDKVTRLKVAANEICRVYNFGHYSGELTINKRIKSDNLLVPDHLAHLIWNGAKYEVDYGEGCTYLRDFEKRKAYISLTGDTLENAMLYLPGNRGQCQIKSAVFIENVEDAASNLQSPIKNIQYKAENNQAYFYWDVEETDKKWFYLISHSRYQLNPEDYELSQMPFLRYTSENQYTAKGLVNDRTYYFYISARDEYGNVTPWQEVVVTPIKTVRVFKNNPDPEEFEIELIEDSDSRFVLEWPDKSENSKRYMVQFFVDGKRKIFDIISGDINEFIIEKTPEYEGTRFKLTVRSLPKNRFGARYYDGIYWESD